MKYFSIAILFQITTFLSAQIQTYDYSYISKKGICVYSTQLQKEVLISSNVSEPSISPDGTRLLNKENGCLCLYNLITGERKILNINSRTCLHPRWSPDSKLISYITLYPNINNLYSLSIIDPNNSQITDIQNPIKIKYAGLNSPSWSADSKKILIHNTDSVYILNLNGTVREKHPLIIPPGYSSDNCILTSDEKKIIYQSFVDDPDLWSLTEPVSAIFIYDLTGNSLKRITPESYSCYNPFLLGEKLYFTAYGPESTKGIYSIDLNGSNIKIEFKDCRSFSARLK